LEFVTPVSYGRKLFSAGSLPEFSGNVPQGDDTQTLSRNWDHLPIKVFFATLQLAPDLSIKGLAVLSEVAK